MKSYQFEGTGDFPTIILDKGKGVFSVKGKSAPENAKEFYEEALEWLADYAQEPNAETNFVFELDYFNISSSKVILYVLYRLLEIHHAGHNVKVTWWYSDAYLLGAGRDYAYMVKLPFEFKKVNRKESAEKDLAA